VTRVWKEWATNTGKCYKRRTLEDAYSVTDAKRFTSYLQKKTEFYVFKPLTLR